MEGPFDIAADLDTPVSAFLKLSPLEPRFLLESVEGGEQLGRYSFIGFGEAVRFTLTGDRLFADGRPVATAVERAELLEGLRSCLARSPRPRADGVSLPFRGGLVGVTGYEVASRLDRAPAAPADDLPEAAYLAPRSVLAFDHLTRRAALLHDGPESERRSLRREVADLLNGPLPARPPCGSYGDPSASLRRRGFLSAVERVQSHIAAGDVYQLVLSVRFTAPCEIPPFEAYRALRLLNPSPYMYYIDFGGSAVVGSSPEALVRLNGRQASLRPIAGTRPRGRTAAEDEALERDLLDDPKENAEHVMLVDLARNDLGRVAVPGTITVEPYRTIERYSHVMHMVSGTCGVLAREHDAFDLFAATFPAGTVVGAPKLRAMELIHELEPVRRGVYAGTVGYFGVAGTMDQAIAIRTLVFGDGEVSYQAGAGIVADSVPEHEHEEVLAKAAALEASLRLAREGL